MVVSGLYPEAIRGLWFMVKDGAGMAQDVAKLSVELYVFHINGQFQRVLLREGARREHEGGHYTFDGGFLITRGRTTETYRVIIEGPTHWLLDGKKGMVSLCRGLLDEDDQPLASPALDGPAQRELRILPARVRFERFAQQDQLSAWRILYDRDGKSSPEATWLGTLSTDMDDADTLWCGITPHVAGLEARVWRRFVTEAYLPTHHPGPLKHVITHFLDSGERERVKLA